jgi:hypothetical protein
LCSIRERVAISPGRYGWPRLVGWHGRRGRSRRRLRPGTAPLGTEGGQPKGPAAEDPASGIVADFVAVRGSTRRRSLMSLGTNDMAESFGEGPRAGSGSLARSTPISRSRQRWGLGPEESFVPDAGGRRTEDLSVHSLHGPLHGQGSSTRGPLYEPIFGQGQLSVRLDALDPIPGERVDLLVLPSVSRRGSRPGQ